METIETFAGTIRANDGFLNPESEESNLVVIDDTWLKLSQLMWTRNRKTGRTNRKTPLTELNGSGWATLAVEDARQRKRVFRRAGEVLCYMGGLSEDPILYFRDGDAPTILDLLDPVQIFIPAPVLSNVNRSKVVENLRDDKGKTVTILAEIME